jgi:Xaa-Pro aminopeptidase
MSLGSTRIDKVRDILSELHLDAFYISHIPNIRYLTGFSGSSAAILITNKKNYFVTDFRYKDQSAAQIKGFEVIINYNHSEEFKKVFDEYKLRKIGFESKHVVYSTFEDFKKKFTEAELVPVFERIEKLTMQKTPDEIAKIKKAVEISDRTFSKMLEFIKPGMTELEVSAEITYTHKKFGASKDSFDPIVASGWRGSLPHGIASDKVIEKGEMVTLDFGCVYDGFCSDITRTIALGEPSDKLKDIYNIVLNAQQKAINAAHAGASSKEVDGKARDLISGAGFGDNFGHGLGHGLGIEVHELPGLSPRTDMPLPENLVVTIEPGIYVESLGGVRIEDDILITANGCEVLNKSPKELIII